MPPFVTDTLATPHVAGLPGFAAVVTEKAAPLPPLTLAESVGCVRVVFTTAVAAETSVSPSATVIVSDSPSR